MDCLLLNQHTTFFTQKHDKIVCTDTANGPALVRELYSYKKLTNVNQLDHIIHYLVIENGFMMDSCSKEKVVFRHPQNNIEHNVVYIYWPTNMEMEKIDHRLLEFV